MRARARRAWRRVGAARVGGVRSARARLLGCWRALGSPAIAYQTGTPVWNMHLSHKVHSSPALRLPHGISDMRRAKSNQGAAVGDRPTDLLRPGSSDGARPSRARGRPRAAPRFVRPCMIARGTDRAARDCPGPPGTDLILDNLRTCASRSTIDSTESYTSEHVRLGALEAGSRDSCVRTHPAYPA